MSKTTCRALTLSVAGTLLCGISFAQQSSAPSTNPPAPSTTTSPAPKPQNAPAAEAGQTPAAETPAPVGLETQKAKASYAIGMNLGKGLKENLKKDDIDVDPDNLARGLKDVLAGNKPLLTDEEFQAVLVAVQNDVRKHQKELHDAAAAKNAKEGEAFLAANKTKDGVVALHSGLQYKILQPGTGPKPAAGDSVTCNYRGTHLDGTEFDSSYKRGQPAKFPVTGVVKGWTEALQLMPVGSKWQLFIPSDLAYGEAGTPRGGPIGPNETLVFEVELISIQPKTPPAALPQLQPQAKPQTQPQAQPQAPPQAKPQ